MRIFERMTVLRTLFPEKRVAREAVHRWTQAVTREPELAGDVIRLGGIMAKAPARYQEGVALPDPVDPYAMAKREGRRELAVELLAMMQVTATEFHKIMEMDE